MYPLALPQGSIVVALALRQGSIRHLENFLVDLESPCPCLETTDGVSAGPPAAPSPLHPRLVKRLSLQLQGPPLATARHPLRKPSKPYQADDDMPHLDSASQDKLASLQQARRACLLP